MISATSNGGRVIVAAASVKVGHRPYGKAAGDRGDWNRLQVSMGQVQVDQSVFQAGVSEPDLDGAQVGSRVQQMGGTTVPETVWRQVFADAGLLGGLATSQPDDVGGDGDVGAFAGDGAGKQVGLGLPPAPVEAQAFQQFRTQGHIAVAAALALVNADHHALTVDVTDLETAKFGTSHGGGIQGHEQGAVIEIVCRIDEPRHFLRAEYDGQPPGRFGERNVLGEKMPA